MSAIYINLNKSDIFHSGGSADGLVKIPSVDSIVGESVLAIYHQVSLSLGETIQYFLTFDDVIKFIHFGKALGTVGVEGTMYSTCDGDIPALSEYADAFTALRGEMIKVTIGGIVVDAVMTNSGVSLINETDTMANFTFSFSVVSHQL
jgi:hypothetical protein